MKIKVPTKTDPRFRTRPAGLVEIDSKALSRDLRAAIEGEVRFSPGDRALYAAGGSN